MQHTPPSTHILRDLIDVQAIDAVPWWPGFADLPTGWWYIMLVCTVIILILIAVAIKYTWQNRYRREACFALKNMMNKSGYSNSNALNGDQKSNPASAQQLFYLLKQVLIYIKPRSAKLSDNTVLIMLDELIKPSESWRWQNELGQRWMASLYNPNLCLTNNEMAILCQQSQHWLKSHKNTLLLMPAFLASQRGQ